MRFVRSGGNAIRLLSFSVFLMLTATVTGAQTATSGPRTKVAVYAAVGPELTTYNLDVEAATLVKQATVTLPQNVQEAWPHPSRRYLYVTWSNTSGGTAGQHGVTAFRIDPASGALQPHGQPISLPARSVFMTVDIPGNHLVIAYNEPSGATVHRIAADGTIGGAVPQVADLDFGVYAHQVRVDPSNGMVILITRGNGPTTTKPEDPGALKVFGYKDGVLSNQASIAPGGGYNFQPRHLEFHPTRPFVFITLERQNKLQVYRKVNGRASAPLLCSPRRRWLIRVVLPARRRARSTLTRTVASFTWGTGLAAPSISKGNRFWPAARTLLRFIQLTKRPASRG